MIWRVVYDAINLTSCFPTFYVSCFYKFKITNNYIIIMYTNELWSIVQIKQPKCHPFRYSCTTANNFSISGEGPIHSWWCLCFMTCHKHMSHIQRNMVSAEKFQLWTIIIGAVINSLKKRSLQIRNSFLLYVTFQNLTLILSCLELKI